MNPPPSLAHTVFTSTPEIQNLCTELTDLIEANKYIFNSRSFAQELQKQGYLFNQLSATLFDRVFSLPNTNRYVLSSADRYSDKTLAVLRDEFQRPLEQLHFLVEKIGQNIFETSHTPGYTLTSKFGFEERERIPVHTHKNISEFDNGNELNLSVAMCLTRKDPHVPARMLFFPYKKEQDSERTHDHLLDTSDCLEFAIKKKVTLFLFDSKRLPHTVKFSEDLILWAVFNGVRPKANYALKGINEVATFE